MVLKLIACIICGIVIAGCHTNIACSSNIPYTKYGTFSAHASSGTAGFTGCLYTLFKKCLFPQRPYMSAAASSLDMQSASAAHEPLQAPAATGAASHDRQAPHTVTLHTDAGDLPPPTPRPTYSVRTPLIPIIINESAGAPSSGMPPVPPTRLHRRLMVQGSCVTVRAQPQPLPPHLWLAFTNKNVTDKTAADDLSQALRRAHFAREWVAWTLEHWPAMAPHAVPPRLAQNNAYDAHIFISEDRTNMYRHATRLLKDLRRALNDLLANPQAEAIQQGRRLDEPTAQLLRTNNSCYPPHETVRTAYRNLVAAFKTKKGRYMGEEEDAIVMFLRALGTIREGAPSH